jgi:transposase
MRGFGREGRFASFDTDAEGFAALAAFCREHGATLVVMEATGGYEKRAFASLWGWRATVAEPSSLAKICYRPVLFEATGFDD